jgi:hypothetical protein
MQLQIINITGGSNGDANYFVAPSTGYSTLGSYSVRVVDLYVSRVAALTYLRVLVQPL